MEDEKERDRESLKGEWGEENREGKREREERAGGREVEGER